MEGGDSRGDDGDKGTATSGRRWRGGTSGSGGSDSEGGMGPAIQEAAFRGAAIRRVAIRGAAMERRERRWRGGDFWRRGLGTAIVVGGGETDVLLV